eukprot:4694544-Amphidinium_carterae.2
MPLVFSACASISISPWRCTDKQGLMMALELRFGASFGTCAATLKELRDAAKAIEDQLFF